MKVLDRAGALDETLPSHSVRELGQQPSSGWTSSTTTVSTSPTTASSPGSIRKTTGSIRKSPKKIRSMRNRPNLQQSTNLSVGGRGTWPESPSGGSRGSPSSTPSSCSVDSTLVQSLGRGEEGRSATGALVVIKVMGTLCAHDSLDCRHTSFVINGSKTTDTLEPGASDQLERSNFHL